MRTVVGVLLAAAVGIHCSVSTEAPDATSSPELVAASPQPAQSEAPAEPSKVDEPQRVDNVHHTGPAAPDFDPLIPESATTHVTSTATDSTGAGYATGTFEGRIVVADIPLQSRGDKDVFLIKVDARGQFQWVRTVGSGMSDSGPRVTVDDASGQVHLVGTTKGRLDCGSGPLSAWSSDTFFFCVFGAVDGAALSGGVFPTGSP